MAANAYRGRPVWYQPRHICHHDRFAENGTVQNITDGAVRRFPHLFKVKFFYAFFVGCNGGALYSHAVLFYSIGRINGYLVISIITMFDPQVVVFDIQVQVWEYQLIFYKLPDNTGHFIPVQFNYRVCYFNFRHLYTVILSGPNI